MVKVLIPVGDVLLKINLAGVDCAGEQKIAVVKDYVALIVGLHDREEEHVIHVCRGHDSPTLAGGSHGSEANFLIALRTDDSLSSLRVLEEAEIRNVGMEAVSHEFTNQGYLAIPIGGGVPHVSQSFSMTLPFGPFTRKCPLIPLVHYFIALDY